MPNMQYTDITFILDRSGSMSDRRDETINGFNTFIEEQKKEPGRAVVSLIQFDDKYTSYETADALAFSGVDISQVPKLTREKFVPRGSTALRMAICRAIDETGKRLADMPEHTRPGKVLFVIMTDGLENASHLAGPSYGPEQTKGRITHQQNVYSWNFMYIGTNQDAVLAANSFGINAGNTMNYGQSKEECSSAFTAMSAGVKSYRGKMDTARDFGIAADAVRLSDDSSLKTMNAHLSAAPAESETTKQV